MRSRKGLSLAVAVMAGVALSANAVDVNLRWGSPADFDRIQRFDDRVFDFSPPRPAPGEREYGDESEYTTAQARIWKRICRRESGGNWDRYRDCFEARRKRNAEGGKFRR